MKIGIVMLRSSYYFHRIIKSISLLYLCFQMHVFYNRSVLYKRKYPFLIYYKNNIEFINIAST